MEATNMKSVEKNIASVALADICLLYTSDAADE